MLEKHKVRGAFAACMNHLAADFKSVAASGWGPELIPEEDIVQSQFPEVLQEIEADQTRIAELERLFAAASSTDDEDTDEATAEEAEESTDGVLPKAKVKALKEEKKALSGEIRQMKKQISKVDEEENQDG